MRAWGAIKLVFPLVQENSINNRWQSCKLDVCIFPNNCQPKLCRTLDAELCSRVNTQVPSQALLKDQNSFCTLLHVNYDTELNFTVLSPSLHPTEDAHLVSTQDIFSPLLVLSQGLTAIQYSRSEQKTKLAISYFFMGLTMRLSDVQRH